MINPTLEQIKQLEDNAQKTLRSLRDQREALENAERDSRLESIKPLVIRAHDLLCCWNHTDGCGWGYEVIRETGKHNWQGWAHARWLRHFEELLLGKNSKNSQPLSVEQLTKILDVVEELRKTNPLALHIIRHGICAP